jgi:hypothetical protein
MERSGNDKKEKPYRFEQRAEENSYTSNSRESKGKDFYSFSEKLITAHLFKTGGIIQTCSRRQILPQYLQSKAGPEER